MVLLDIGMPKLDGYEVALDMKQGWGADAVLLALSGWVNKRTNAVRRRQDSIVTDQAYRSSGIDGSPGSFTS